MRTAARRATAFLLLGALACGDDSPTRPDSGPRVYDAGPACTGREPSAQTLGNNSAVLTGPAIGTGEDPLEALRETVEVELTAPAALEVGRAWAMRGSSVNQEVWLVIEVTNPTDQLFCRITTESYRWLDEAGDPIRSREQVWLTGSIGLDDELDAMTCLAAGETGYLLDFSPEGTEPWGDLSAVELELGYTGEDPGLPGLAVVPTAYSADEFGRFGLQVENTGSETARFDTDRGTFGELVLLDDEGAPLGFAGIAGEITPADGVLEPGATGTVAYAEFYGGCAASVRPFLAFRP